MSVAASGAGTQTAVAGVMDAAAFPVVRPLVLDLGCGNGVSLAALASSEPACNFLGIEKKTYRVRQARRRAGGLPNARIVQGEVTEILSELSPASVSRMYLLFSDPWPKRRHAARRVVQDDFLALVGSRLAPCGSFFFATDSAAYLAWATARFLAAGWSVSDWQVPDGWPSTEFEQRFEACGVQIGRFQANR